MYTYIAVYVLVPVFLLKGKYLIFFGSLAVSTALASLLKLLVGRYIYYALFIPEALHPKEWFSLDSFLVNLIWVMGPAIVFAMFKYYKNWMRSQDIANEAERKRLASELQVLKAQLNPHFLFNTFNNLYVLALQKSDKTPVVISKMSDMFHYILYECNATEVPVSKEIKLIEDFIELEQLRYTDRLSVSFEKHVDSYNYLIPPMLLYTFVENCFKHGSSPDPDSPWIKISIRIKNESFIFEASNSIPKAKKRDKEITGGVGLLNIRRRLELIYPQNHQLNISNGNDEFFVKLVINKALTIINESNG
jgi:LytS/YehU family sensor histidine kinase